MSNKQGKVILTHARSLHALAAARSLGRKGIEVVGGDYVPLMAMSFSRHASDTFLHPPPESPDFLDCLMSEIEARAPQDKRVPYVVMPVHSSTRFLARHRDRIEQHARLAAPDYEAIDRVDPKDNLARTLEGSGVPAPETRFLDVKDDVKEFADGLAYPRMVKLADGTASVGQAKVDSAFELVEHVKQLRETKIWVGKRPLLVQELVPGQDYCVTTLFDHGELRASMVYRNLRTFPPERGFGVLRETVDAPVLVEQSKKLLGPLGWNGIAEIDFRWDGTDSTPYLIEINPRFWGGLFQSVESGVDYPWLLYQLTVNGRVDPAPPAEVGVQTKVPFVGLLSAILETIEDDEPDHNLKAAWLDVCEEMKQGNLFEAFGELSSAMADYISPVDRLRAVNEWMAESRNASTEIFSTDDPAASLGILYILGSLLRSGTLPEEISRGARAPASED